jgi:hypothetical protein
MNPRARFVLIFYGYCFAMTFTMAATIFFMKTKPSLRWAILCEVIVLFTGTVWITLRLRKNLPKPSIDQRLRGARAAKRMGWIYLGGLALGLATNWRETLWGPPHGFGFLLPLLPICFATHYFRLAARLKASGDAESTTLSA